MNSLPYELDEPQKLSEIIAISTSWRLSGKLLPPGLRLPQPVTQADLPGSQSAVSSAPAIRIGVEVESAASSTKTTSHSSVDGSNSASVGGEGLTDSNCGPVVATK